MRVLQTNYVVFILPFAEMLTGVILIIALWNTSLLQTVFKSSYSVLAAGERWSVYHPFLRFVIKQVGVDACAISHSTQTNDLWTETKVWNNSASCKTCLSYQGFVTKVWDHTNMQMQRETNKFISIISHHQDTNNFFFLNYLSSIKSWFVI